jgi:hypothetical protein
VKFKDASFSTHSEQGAVVLQITMHSRCSWGLLAYKIVSNSYSIMSLNIYKTPLHRVASTAKEKVSEVRFRGVVSAER